MVVRAGTGLRVREGVRIISEEDGAAVREEGESVS